MTTVTVQTPNLRIGHGYDIHRLRAGGRLVLGGIVVAEDISPVAHSDGDVVIHAIADALLGALGLGDIGEHFPDSDPAYRGVASTTFLEKIKEHLAAAGMIAIHCDVTIMAERPRLTPFKPAMRTFLKTTLGCDVNIKAGTNEGCGEIGRGEAIAAHAVVLIGAKC